VALFPQTQLNGIDTNGADETALTTSNRLLVSVPAPAYLCWVRSCLLLTAQAAMSC
jgi:hypothetical protein